MRGGVDRRGSWVVMAEQLLDDRQRHSSHRQVHPISVAKCVRHGPLRWGDSGTGGETSERPVDELLGEWAAVVPHEQARPGGRRTVQPGSLLEIHVDRGQSPSRDRHVAWLVTLRAGPHLQQHLLPVTVDAPTMSPTSWLTRRPRCASVWTNGDVPCWPCRSDVDGGGAAAAATSRSTSSSERQHLPEKERLTSAQVRRTGSPARAAVARASRRTRAASTGRAGGSRGRGRAPSRSSARSRTSTSPSSVITNRQPSSECGGNVGHLSALDGVDRCGPSAKVATAGPVRVADVVFRASDALRGEANLRDLIPAGTPTGRAGGAILGPHACLTISAVARWTSPATPDHAIPGSLGNVHTETGRTPRARACLPGSNR